MKYLRLLSLIVCACAAHTLYGALPYLALRSQSVNAVRELVGQQTFMHRDADAFYGVFSVTPEYTDSIEREKLAQCLFGPDVCCGKKGAQIAVVGSLAGVNGATVMNTPCNPTSWLADYFGLPRDFKSLISLEPRIQNFNIDFNFYLGWRHGVYFRIHAPLTYTNWNLNYCEEVYCGGKIGYEPGYFSPDENPVDDLLCKATDFLTGCRVPNLSPEYSEAAPIIFHPLAYSRFPRCACPEIDLIRLSDVEAALGWDCAIRERFHFGFEVRTSAPTGNKPCATYLFWPLIGDGGAWKLGVGISSHGILWQSTKEDISLGFWLQANVQHIFNTCQDRVFDLCGKPNSRYMLAEKMTTTEDSLLEGSLTYSSLTPVDPSPSDFQFAHEYTPVANLTKRAVNVSIPVEGDVVAKLAWTYKNLQLDVGYEFWGRSCEKICTNNCCYNHELDGNTWALKGDAHVYGFVPNELFIDGDGEEPGFWIPLAASESCATIHRGTNYIPGRSLDYASTDAAAQYNPGIDHPHYAYYAGPVVRQVQGGEYRLQTRTSIQPILLSTSSVDYCGAASKGMSNKIFAHINHIWKDKPHTPFFGAGASVEFGSRQCASCSSSSATCNGCNWCCPPATGCGCLNGVTSNGTTCNDCCTNTTTNNCLACCGCASTCCNRPCCENSYCGTNCDDHCCKECALSQWAIWIKFGIGF